MELPSKPRRAEAPGIREGIASRVVLTMSYEYNNVAFLLRNGWDPPRLGGRGVESLANQSGTIREKDVSTRKREFACHALSIPGSLH